MEAIVVYFTKTGNTKKVANAIARGLGKNWDVKMVSVEKANLNEIVKAEIIGFGSGIYYGQPGEEFGKFVNKLPSMEGKSVFLFSTSGTGGEKLLRPVRERLEEKGADVIGEFGCKAYDNWGPLKLIGGINKGRPDSKDLARAKEFGEKLGAG